MMFSCKKGFGVLGGVFSLVIALGVAQTANAGTLTVAKTGGTTATTRAQAITSGYYVRTIQGAIDLSNDYDIIKVKPDTYTESLRIGRSEKPATSTTPKIPAINRNHLTIQPTDDANGNWLGTPIITSIAGENSAIVKIQGSTFIYFGGFEINGTGTGRDCSGVIILPSNSSAGITKSLQVDIKFCKVHDLGGTGIGTNLDEGTKSISCDYVRIFGNRVYATNKSGIYNSSAISILVDQKSDNGSGYHDVIDSNTIYDNVNNNPDQQYHTDCNGIIVDSTGANGTPTVVKNNLIYNNYGRGIHIFDSDNVDVLNNTCYQNCRDPKYSTSPDVRFGATIGEITIVGFGGASKNVNVYNNISSSRAGIANYVAYNYGSFTNSPTNTAYPTYTIDASVKFNYNSCYGGPDTRIIKGLSSTVANLFAINPQFEDAAGRNFRLKTGSEAIDKGTTIKYANKAIDGTSRPLNGGGVDLGAYERVK